VAQARGKAERGRVFVGVVRRLRDLFLDGLSSEPSSNSRCPMSPELKTLSMFIHPRETVESCREVADVAPTRTRACARPRCVGAGAGSRQSCPVSLHHNVADGIHILMPFAERPDEKECVHHFVCIQSV
jgi:hypothetical protein